MNNKSTIIILVGVFLLVGVYLFVGKNNKTQNNIVVQENELTTEEDQVIKSGNNSQSQVQSMNEKYVEYSEGVLEKHEDKRRVIFFYANWCPTCRIADPDFSKNKNTFPDDVVLIRVNYNDPNTDDNEKELADKYGITYQHTFVQIDQQGNAIAKWNGGKTQELLKNLK